MSNNPVNKQPSDEDIRRFICDDGLEHRIGQRYDERRGTVNGPQICLRCQKTLLELIKSDRARILERVESVIGEDEHFEGTSKEKSYDTYINVVKAEQRKALEALRSSEL